MSTYKDTVTEKECIRPAERERVSSLRLIFVLLLMQCYVVNEHVKKQPPQYVSLFKEKRRETSCTQSAAIHRSCLHVSSEVSLLPPWGKKTHQEARSLEKYA